jgi:UrcA family protein
VRVSGIHQGPQASVCKNRPDINLQPNLSAITPKQFLPSGGVHINHMYTKTAFMSAWPVLGAPIVACTLFAGNVAANEVTVAIQVSTRGLDVSQPGGAQKLYWRLQHAARVACTSGNRVGLAPSPDPQGCYEKALGNAVRSAKVPLLTQAYLATHTLREAAARGIDVPVQIAAK